MDGSGQTGWYGDQIIDIKKRDENVTAVLIAIVAVINSV